MLSAGVGGALLGPESTGPTYSPHRRFPYGGVFGGGFVVSGLLVCQGIVSRERPAFTQVRVGFVRCGLGGCLRTV